MLHAQVIAPASTDPFGSAPDLSPVLAAEDGAASPEASPAAPLLAFFSFFLLGSEKVTPGFDDVPPPDVNGRLFGLDSIAPVPAGG